MDPLSQGILGAAAPQSIAPPEHVRMACLLGFLAGMAPDLDVLIRSDSDPLLFLIYHRQFTHALVFIPAGGAICGCFLHWVLGRRRGLRLGASILYCTLGYATHALLDACTTYGTQLFWPFSDYRFAWNTVSVVDPLFTLPLLLLIGLSVRFRKTSLARIGLAWAMVYLAVGLVQRERAELAGRELAAARGHTPIRLEAKPGFGNLLLWKLVYESDGVFHVDAVRLGLTTRIFAGDSVPRLDLQRDFPWLAENTQQARDVARFDWFSRGYVAVDPRYPERITDIRYSMLPNEIAGLWSIVLCPGADANQHVQFIASRDMSAETLQQFKAMLFE